MLNNQKGFILISIIFIMILMAVTIFSINYYSATQLQMSSNQVSSVRTGYDLKAVVEHSVWKLTDNLFWRTAVTGEDYTFNGTTYTRIVSDADTAPFNYPSNYDDAVTVQVVPKGATQSFQRSFRYYIKEISGLSTSLPERIFLDPLGNLLIADTGNHKIIIVNLSTSAVTTIAGTGTGGYSGDGLFTDASPPQLNSPKGICTNAAGTYYYIADTANHRIRRILYSGFSNFWDCSTLAGDGTNGYSGDTGNATSAQLSSPEDVFNDSSGHLYIADSGNHCIRMVDLSAGIITTVAGDGTVGSSGDGGAATSAKLKSPSGIFKDSSGNLFIADSGNYKIRKVNTSGIISTVAGNGFQGNTGDGGSATNARLRYPVDMVVDPNNNIFIADRQDNKIRVVNALNGYIYALAGTATSGDTVDIPAVSALLKDPSGITMASSYGGGRIYISDMGNSKIKVLLFKTVYGL